MVRCGIPPSPTPTDPSHLWNQAHDQHPADDGVPEERRLPALTHGPHEAVGAKLPGRGADPAAGGGRPAHREEEVLTPSQAAWAQGQRSLRHRHERVGDQRIGSLAGPHRRKTIHLPSRWGGETMPGIHLTSKEKYFLGVGFSKTSSLLFHLCLSLGFFFFILTYIDYTSAVCGPVCLRTGVCIGYRGN